MLVASKQKANDQLFSEMVSRARSSSVCLPPATPWLFPIDRMQETKMHIRLANKDAVEESLRKEVRELKKSLEDAKVALADGLQKQKEQSANEQLSSNQLHKSELEAARAQIQLLNRELSTLKADADHASLSKQNKQLNAAIAQLDKEFAKSEKKVRFQ